MVCSEYSSVFGFLVRVVVGNWVEKINWGQAVEGTVLRILSRIII